MHALEDHNGESVTEARLFTTASVRGILHNPSYAGQVTHDGKLLPGVHESLVTKDLFATLQDAIRSNTSGRYLPSLPVRAFELKALLR